MSLLHKYQNGNVTVSLFADGTKTRTWEGAQALEFPESIDLKVTNFCDVGCLWCHESSVRKDNLVKGADYEQLIRLLEPLPQGVELAIGGGDPLSWPYLSVFINWASNKGFVCNMTVNQRSLNEDFVRDHVVNHRYTLIQGVGISLDPDIIWDVETNEIRTNETNRLDPLLRDVLASTPNCVLHVIAGVHDYTIIEALCDMIVSPKILILGYKNYGLGTTLDKHLVANNIKWMRRAIIKAFSGNDRCNTPRLSFDNLALQQLRVRDLVTKEAWNKYYMGADFTSSMYVDGVQQMFAPTSTTTNKTPWSSMGLIDYFKTHKNV